MDLANKRIRKITSTREILLMVKKQVLAQKNGVLVQLMRVSGNIITSMALATTSGLNIIRVIKVSMFTIKYTALA